MAKTSTIARSKRNTEVFDTENKPLFSVWESEGIYARI